jgi:hypothetical protein
MMGAIVVASLFDLADTSGLASIAYIPQVDRE